MKNCKYLLGYYISLDLEVVSQTKFADDSVELQAYIGGIWVYFTDPDKYMFILKTHIFCYTTGLSKIMYLSQFNVFNTLT